MGSGLKIDVQWSPCCADRFITFGTELNLFQVEEITSDTVLSSLTHRVSETKHAQIIFTNPNPQFLKCVAWYPTLEYEYLLAIGLANGKINLTNLANNQEPNFLVGKELVPRYPRQCNCISWNPIECNLLVAGLDRARTDHSILIWDILKCNTVQDTERRLLGSSNSIEPNVLPVKPLIETGNSETIHSLHWFKQQPKIFVSGMSNKHLKIYDIRDASKAQSVTATKAVYGITVDPFMENRVASFSEGQIVIWDIRNFEKPITTLSESRPTSKIAWCPTRSNLLASVAKDSPILKLYDLPHTFSADEVELNAVERYLLPCGDQLVSSFSWHPTNEKRILLINPSGGVTDFNVFERITVSWSPSLRLIWTEGLKCLKDVDDEAYFDNLEDISTKMKQRALKGYGLKDFETGRVSMVTKDAKINALWAWVDMVKTMQEEGRFSTWTRPFKYQGVRDIICAGKIPSGSGTNTNSEAINQSWPNVLPTSTTRIYCSKDRDYALQLCGWDCNRDGQHLAKLLERLEREKAFERAAAIAVFNLQIQRAIESLKKGALHETPGLRGVNLNVVAMALSGYTAERTALWRKQCYLLRDQLSHPYIRAMFSFLTCDEENYEEVLNERDLAMQDRIAFACWFLNDAKLSDFLNKLTTKMISRGNVDGILLTGLISDGLDLIQQYVDTTGDVQTPCLVIMYACPIMILEDARVRQWVECYRSLLDHWQLWHQRARFDVQWNKVNAEAASRPLQRIYISCNYCGKSISSSMGSRTTSMNPKTHHPVMFANKTKMTSCPGCRKPLPRCAICLINMGTASGTGIVKFDSKGGASELRLTKFSSWFTWCQSCRHGGHAGHILEWFKDHAECPVSGCSCKCMALDSIS